MPAAGKLWTAPELLRIENAPREGTTRGDVYSFAIVCHEIVYRRGPFFLEGQHLEPQGACVPSPPHPSRAHSCHRVHSLRALLTCCLCRYHRCRQKGQPPAASHHQSGRSRPSSTRVLVEVYTHLQYRTTISKLLVHHQSAVSQVPPQLVQLIERCWSEHPLARPDFPRIKSAMRRINRCAARLTRLLARSLDTRLVSLCAT